MKTRSICIFTLISITLASCKLSQEASLRTDHPWASHEKSVEEALPQDDLDYEMWEDDFDYDEFDATR